MLGALEYVVRYLVPLDVKQNVHLTKESRRMEDFRASFDLLKARGFTECLVIRGMAGYRKCRRV